jgi:hypothetical protein
VTAHLGLQAASSGLDLGWLDARRVQLLLEDLPVLRGLLGHPHSAVSLV